MFLKFEEATEISIAYLMRQDICCHYLDSLYAMLCSVRRNYSSCQFYYQNQDFEKSLHGKERGATG